MPSSSLHQRRQRYISLSLLSIAATPLSGLAFVPSSRGGASSSSVVSDPSSRWAPLPAFPSVLALSSSPSRIRIPRSNHPQRAAAEDGGSEGEISTKVEEKEEEPLAQQQPSSSVLSSSSRDVNYEEGLWPQESRQLLGILGTLGFLETSYLTYQKLIAQDLTSLCSVGSLSLRCGDVLNSEWANFLGIPLTLPGMLAYGAVAALAFYPFLSSQGSRERVDADLSTRDPLLVLTTSMAAFSTYLMFILITQLHVACPFCLASAAISYALATLTWSKQIVPNATKSAVYKAGSLLVAASFSGGAYLYSSARILVTTQASMGDGLLHAPPPISTHSDHRSVQLATKLQSLDAKMYGAFWCSHCFEQKQTLGKEAYAKIAYIECAPDGVDSKTPMCKSRKVPGYPTWEIAGELYPGEKSVDELEEIAEASAEATVVSTTNAAAAADGGQGA